ncbi:hypothetical protein JN403_00570 [Pseudomonas sp. 15A4]|uniref:hypothetical protein n=1 Tax=Pseudomonas sp. 15A4 TaxID=2804761 RepID=UPI001967D722|nr:hypothetical protein [Pseudomonas sp. 15A4]QSB19643.1 hypothetical protein JN403_00570 [Pseudomonas sp. 15A4]
MLGGQWETPESAQQTIDFSVECGVTLAYFALYKDFSSASSVLSKEQHANDPKSESYIRYKQLTLNWDRKLTDVRSNPVSLDFDMGGSPITEQELKCYRELSTLGFQFADLVKYNDFHSEEPNGGKLLHSVTWGHHRSTSKSLSKHTVGSICEMDLLKSIAHCWSTDIKPAPVSALGRFC